MEGGGHRSRIEEEQELSLNYLSVARLAQIQMKKGLRLILFIFSSLDSLLIMRELVVCRIVPSTYERNGTRWCFLYNFNQLPVVGRPFFIPPTAGGSKLDLLNQLRALIGLHVI